jgi:serine phosphatase RsbU (regulator of sigma subunit)
LKANRERAASEIVDTVIAAIDAFVGDAPQFDDITLMIMKRL